MGSVAGIRRIKPAIAVARAVLEHTTHSVLAGDLATKFAVEMGFKEESLETEYSNDLWRDWANSDCQPNFWTVSCLVVDFYFIFWFYNIYKPSNVILIYNIHIPYISSIL